jgi:hypothetical protein
VCSWLCTAEQYLFAALLTLLCGVLGYVGFRWYMQRVVQRCLAIQLAALREYQPDMVVGRWQRSFSLCFRSRNVKLNVGFVGCCLQPLALVVLWRLI